MTYSEETRQTLIKMKKAGATFRMIGLALGKKTDAVRKWWAKNRANLHLPTKVKVSKKITDGRVGLEIKRIVRETPSSSISDIRSKLLSSLGPKTPCPSLTTIRNYLKVVRSNKL